jgi:DNA helicase-2/ATP-dependent DNA helicase PcrA
VAGLVHEIIKSGKVQDPNEIAFLFPSLRSRHVQRMRNALEQKGLSVYAPRAGTFLGVDESTAMFGLFFQIFGRENRGDYAGADYQGYYDWVDHAYGSAKQLVERDRILARYVDERRAELTRTKEDFRCLTAISDGQGWRGEDVYDPDSMRPLLENARGIAQKTSQGASPLEIPARTLAAGI